MNENDIQRAVFTHLRTRGAPGVFAFHPKNGGIHQRGRRRGINAGLGVVSGVPDVIIIREGHCFALELKADKGKVSPVQIETLDAMERAGVTVNTVWGLDGALVWLEDMGLLKGRAA